MSFSSLSSRFLYVASSLIFIFSFEKFSDSIKILSSVVSLYFSFRISSNSFGLSNPLSPKFFSESTLELFCLFSCFSLSFFSNSSLSFAFSVFFISWLITVLLLLSTVVALTGIPGKRTCPIINNKLNVNDNFFNIFSPLITTLSH